MPFSRRSFLAGLSAVASGTVAPKGLFAFEPTKHLSRIDNPTRTTVLFMDDADVLQYTPYPATREHLANYVRFLANGCNWKCESNSGIRIGERISGIDDFVRDKSVGIL